jgi:hypothetical protein
MAPVSLEINKVVGMTAKEETSGGPESLVALIAWLSTCLLAAGLGTMMDASTHILWLRAGCFGLVAAVGLDVSARLRARHKRMQRFRALKHRCDRSLEMIATERDIAAELRTAAKQLLTAHPLNVSVSLPDGEEQRWTCNLPIEVYAVRQENSAECLESDAVGVLGQLNSLSNSGFGLTLEEHIEARLVVIAMLPPNEQEFDLLAEILWRDPRPNGQMRVGGRMLRVLPRGTRSPEESSSTETDAMPAEAAC